jgi:RNA polymerase sigma-70 factor (ECF subfamily)
MDDARRSPAMVAPAEPADGSAAVPPYLPSTKDESFEAFFACEYRRLVTFAQALSGDRATAEDLAQDAMWAACRRWDEVGAYDDPGAWVRRAVANRSVSRGRRLMVETRALARLGQRRPPGSAEPSEGPEAFWSAVRELPPRQAQTVALRYLEDASTAEIATVLGCTESTVRVHLARGRATLARRLDLEWEEKT